MRHILLKTILLFLIYSCGSTQPATIQNYPNQVGDIAFNAALDDTTFTVCHERWIQQYYSYGVKGEKSVIINHFKEKYTSKGLEGETGCVTIRFIVNCEGKAGRFRIQEMDFNYNPKTFAPSLIHQLLQLTQQLPGWPVAQRNNYKFDYYYYLTFKIINGDIKQIMP